VLAGAAREAVLAQASQQAAPAAPPKQARITSSVMLWTLKGTLEEKLAKSAHAGVQSTELVSEHLAWSEAEVARYKRVAQSYGLAMDALLGQHDWTKRPVTMVNPDHRDGFLNDVKDSIAWAKKLGIQQIIVMSGNLQPGMSHEAQYASMVESGKRAADLAAEANVTLILEPLNSKVDHKGYYLTSCKEGLQAVKDVDNPHFRLLFDIYHEYVQNGNPISTINEAMPYVAVFHVADAPGRHDPGTGKMPWDEIYKTIGKAAYAGYIAMEYVPVGNEVESLIKSVTQMRKDVNSASPPPAPTVSPS